jgi:RNA polymerase sigma-70 factor, ECF subfamily
VGEEPAGVTDEQPYVAASFEEVYRREYGPLVRLAVVLTGRVDVAEELVQDAFEAAHRRWDRLGGYDRPGAWVRRVVLNAYASRHRRLRVEARALLRLGGRRTTVVEFEPDDHELLAAVGRLPRRQAQVLALVLVDDRSIADVAELLRCSEPTVRTHLRRGRLALATQLGVTTATDEQHEEER